MTADEIVSAVGIGYGAGLRSFVLQSGEDVLYYSEKMLCDIIYAIKNAYADCALTLSLGEKSKSEYRSYKGAGADRYLLRHETADSGHYSMLHPESMTLESRMKCLYELKELGFQTGAGFMVGSPYQTDENLCDDLIFLQSFKPDMVGIGPFIPHKRTPFADFKAGGINKTLLMLCLTRVVLPNVLMPATTAMATVSENGRAAALASGANVVMPSVLESDNTSGYNIYDGKVKESLNELIAVVTDAGMIPAFERGDVVCK